MNDLIASKIEIKTKMVENIPLVSTKIFLDGNEIHGVRNYVLKQDSITGYPILSIDLNALNLSVETPLLRVNQAGMGDIKCIEFSNGMKVETGE